MITAHKQVAFNRAYHLSRNHDIQRAREIGEKPERVVELTRLYSAGNDIDPEIDVDLMDAWLTMGSRLRRGQTQVDIWVPPGPSPSPMRTIKVSTDIADYPPCHPARHFGSSNFFELKDWLDDHGIMTGNEERRHFMPAGLLTCSVEEVHLPPGESYFDGAIVHYAVVINTTGKAFDAEALTVIRDAAEDDDAAVAAIKAYVGLK